MEKYLLSSLSLGWGKRTLKSLEILKYGFKLIFQKHFTKHSGAVAFHPERFELV